MKTNPGLLWQHFLGWIALLLLIPGYKAGPALQSGLRAYADPVRLEIGAGQVEDLRIVLENASGAYGIDLQASFDPSVAEVVDASSRQPGIQMLPGGFLEPDFVVWNTADNLAGTLRYVVSQVRPTPAANGAGTVLLIQFRGKKSGTSGTLTINTVVVADRQGNKQIAAVQGAELVIVHPKSPTATPTSLPAGEVVPAAPTWTVPSLTPLQAAPPARPGPTTAVEAPASLPDEVSLAGDPAGALGTELEPSGPAPTGLLLGSLCGVFLLLGLLVWRMAAGRRKRRAAEPK